MSKYAPRRPPPTPPGLQGHNIPISPSRSPPRAHAVMPPLSLSPARQPPQSAPRLGSTPLQGGGGGGTTNFSVTQQQQVQQQSISRMSTVTEVARGPSPGSLSQGGGELGEEITAATTVQTMLLKSRITSMQNEVTKLRNELKESNERCVDLSLQLNKYKMELTGVNARAHKSESKKELLENTVKRMEELLEAERVAHTSTKEMSERFRQQLRAKDDIISSQNSVLEKEKRNHKDQVSGTMHALEMELRRLQDERMQDGENYNQFVNDMTVRLLDLVESNESKLFVCRSEILSYSSDLEARLNRVEQENTRLQSALSEFTQDIEQDTTTLVAKLMDENRRLWMQLQTDYGKMDRMKEEQQSHHAHSQMKDRQLEEELRVTIEQRTVLEREYLQARESLTQVTAQFRTAEVSLEKFREEIKALRGENAVLKEECSHYSATQSELRRTIEAANFSQDETQRQLEHVNAVNLTLSSEIQKFREQNRILEDKIRWEGIDSSAYGEAKKERDVAQRNVEILKKQLDEVTIRYTATERELRARTEYINQLKSNMQETHYSVQRQHQEDFDKQRIMLQAEVQDLRKEVDKRVAEVLSLSNHCDREKMEKDALNTKAISLQQSVDAQLAEIDVLNGELQKTQEAKTRALAEDERLRHQLVALEAKLHHSEENTTKLHDSFNQLRHQYEEEKRLSRETTTLLQSQLQDAENQRRQLAQELRQLKEKIHEDSTTYRVKERLEKDKDLLLRENERLQIEYKDSRNENAELMRLVGELRDKANSSGRIYHHLQSFQRRNQEIREAKDLIEEYRKLYKQVMYEVEERAVAGGSSSTSTSRTNRPGAATEETDRMMLRAQQQQYLPTVLAETYSSQRRAANRNLEGSYTPVGDRAVSPLRSILSDDDLRPR